MFSYITLMTTVFHRQIAKSLAMVYFCNIKSKLFPERKTADIIVLYRKLYISVFCTECLVYKRVDYFCRNTFSLEFFIHKKKTYVQCAVIGIIF